MNQWRKCLNAGRVMYEDRNVKEPIFFAKALPAAGHPTAPVAYMLSDMYASKAQPRIFRQLGLYLRGWVSCLVAGCVGMWRGKSGSKEQPWGKESVRFVYDPYHLISIPDLKMLHFKQRLSAEARRGLGLSQRRHGCQDPSCTAVRSRGLVVLTGVVVVVLMVRLSMHVFKRVVCCKSLMQYVCGLKTLLWFDTFDLFWLGCCGDTEALVDALVRGLEKYHGSIRDLAELNQVLFMSFFEKPT